jgi:5-methylcytosine-specific restriction endonuclease McrA
MSWSTIKRDKADAVFSNYIRIKAGWICEKCGKLCTPSTMDASHYYGRGKESVRFDDENVRALCKGCHKRMGGHTKQEVGEYDLWMKELLGEKRYNALRLRANLPGKKDRQMQFIYWSQMLKELRAE